MLSRVGDVKPFYGSKASFAAEESAQANEANEANEAKDQIEQLAQDFRDAHENTTIPRGVSKTMSYKSETPDHQGRPGGMSVHCAVD